VATGPLEQSTITVEAVPTADEAGLYIALDNGYFKQEGLTVKVTPINGGEYGMTDLQSGKADIVAGNYVSFILAQIQKSFHNKSINIRIIADGSQMQPGNQAVYVMPSSKFKTVADLAKYHATVLINSPNNIGQVLLGSLFSQNGLDLKTAVKQLVIPDFFTQVQDLGTGKIVDGEPVDAAWLPEPFGTIAQETYGAVPLADFDQGALQNFPIGAYIGTDAWVTSHPNTVAAFLRALEEGQEVADTNRSQVELALEKNTGVNSLQAATMTIDSYPLAMDIPTMQRVSDEMYAFGLEPGLPKPYQIINMVQPEPGMIR